MNIDHSPVLSNNVRADVAKNGLFCLGSMLSVALLKRDKAVAIDLPECSDSVTIFRRAADNHEVIWKQRTACCMRRAHLIYSARTIPGIVLHHVIG